MVQTIYDIKKAYSGELKVETKPARAGTDGEGEGSEFIIQLTFVRTMIIVISGLL